MRRIAPLIAALSAAAVLTTSAPAVAADSYCPPGNACLWDFAGWGGGKLVLGAEWAETPYWIPLPTVKKSVRSAFSNRAMWTIFYGNGVENYDCLNPGDFKVGDGRYKANLVWIGGQGSRC